MEQDVIFNFKSDLSNVDIPQKLNNPFGKYIPEIVQIAAKEFQTYITSASETWEHDFQHGKMFGVLVVQKNEESYVYLGTTSGKLSGEIKFNKFIPSVLSDDKIEFLNIGMKELNEIGLKIKSSSNQAEILELKTQRKLKSYHLQQQLFERSRFLNRSGKVQNVLEIFEGSTQRNPPTAAGECAAPKLLQYAFQNGLKPIAIAEFWWGNTAKSNERKHKVFYPACENRCRPILEYMLEDATLFEQAKEQLDDG